MLTFLRYLAESLDVEKLKHLEHVEDHVIHGGHEGVRHAADTLADVHGFMNGKKSKIKITTKYDGAPSIVFGVNPENGKFFVATKSAFNKNPKINYTDEDIEANHGHAPGLVEKLKLALKELPKIMPRDGGVYQGDIMYGKNDVQRDGDNYSFTPNTITYTAPKDSAHGRKIRNAKLGIVVHTQYKGKKGTPLQDMTADFDLDHSKFQQDPDVHMVNPEVNNGEMSSMEKAEYNQHINDATDTYRDMDPAAFDAVEGYSPTMKMYINKCVTNDTVPNTKEYRAYVEERAKKDIDKVKTDAAKQKKQQQLEDKLKHIDDHKENFDAIFGLHHHLQKAKDVLTKSLSRTADTGFKTYIGDKETKPEGFVAIRNGRPSKLVDRAEFSKSNFLAGQFRKSGEEEPEREDDKEAPKKPVVMAYGRMNPPTIGHGALVDKAKELAKENDAPHHIVLSASQDPEKNPLGIDEKMKHAKRFFPGANITAASEDAPSFIDHARKLWKAGHDHLIYVAGSDRVADTKAALEARNGKDYAFKKIDVVSAGQRDPDAEDVAGMSASKMREHAINNRISEFRKGVPSHVSDKHVHELLRDVQSGMQRIDIGPKTSGISLARYAQRQDVIGTRARAEIDRREREKAVKAAAAKKPKKTKIAEEMTSTGGDVRGLGFVTGDPMVSSQFGQTWATLNAADADTKDQIFNAMKKANHDDLHGNVKAPEQLTDKNQRYRALIDLFRGKRL